MSDQDNPREWEHNHPTTNRFAFTGGTEMTSQDELRDRIAAVMYCHKHPLARVEDALRMARGEGMDSKRGQTNVVQRQYLPWAQAIIDEFGMTNEWSFRFEGKDRRYPLNRAEDLRTIGLYGPLEDAAIESRVVGEWEKHD